MCEVKCKAGKKKKDLVCFDCGKKLPGEIGYSDLSLEIPLLYHKDYAGQWDEVYGKCTVCKKKIPLKHLGYLLKLK